MIARPSLIAATALLLLLAAPDLVRAQLCMGRPATTAALVDVVGVDLSRADEQWRYGASATVGSGVFVTAGASARRIDGASATPTRFGGTVGFQVEGARALLCPLLSVGYETGFEVVDGQNRELDASVRSFASGLALGIRAWNSEELALLPHLRIAIERLTTRIEDADGGNRSDRRTHGWAHLGLTLLTAGGFGVSPEVALRADGGRTWFGLNLHYGLGR